MLDRNTTPECKVAAVHAGEHRGVNQTHRDGPDSDYPTTVVHAADDSEAPTAVADVAAAPGTHGIRKWINWKTLASAAVLIIALVVMLPKKRDQSTPKIVENLPHEQASDQSGVGNGAVISSHKTQGIDTLAREQTYFAAAVDKPLDSPASPLSNADRHRIRSLLAQADADIAALRLTTPTGNNAFEKINTVLLLDPSNEAAKKGINRIIEKYLQLAKNAAKSNDVASAQSYIDRASRIQADSPAVLSARTQLANWVAEPHNYTLSERAARATHKSARQLRSSARAFRKKTYRKAQRILRDARR